MNTKLIVASALAAVLATVGALALFWEEHPAATKFTPEMVYTRTLALLSEETEIFQDLKSPEDAPALVPRLVALRGKRERLTVEVRMSDVTSEMVESFRKMVQVNMRPDSADPFARRAWQVLTDFTMEYKRASTMTGCRPRFGVGLQLNGEVGRTIVGGETTCDDFWKEMAKAL